MGLLDPAGHTERTSIASALTLVIPVFNEEDRIQRNIEQLASFIDRQRAGSRLIFVDDGSRDRTVEVARSTAVAHDGITVVERPHLGKGAAVEFGIGLAETPLAGYTDVDLSTPLSEVERLFALSEQRDTLVIGSRGTADSRIGVHQARPRELMGRLFNLWTQAWLTPGIGDTQCGAKFAPSHIWREILGFTVEQGFAWDAEVVALALDTEFGVVEEPIIWSHDPSTRVHVIRDGLAMALSVVRIAFRMKRSPDERRLASWNVDQTHQ